MLANNNNDNNGWKLVLGLELVKVDLAKVSVTSKLEYYNRTVGQYFCCLVWWLLI